MEDGRTGKLGLERRIHDCAMKRPSLCPVSLANEHAKQNGVPRYFHVPALKDREN